MQAEKVAVIGAGVIGCGVAQCLAEADYEVMLIDVSAERLEWGRKQIRQGLRQRLLSGAKGLDVTACLGRIHTTEDYQVLSDRTYVIENVTEDLPLKLGIYARMDQICPPECIFAANTSTIPVARLAEATVRPAQLVGIHFMNPVPLKPAVEVIHSPETAAATLERTHSLLKTIGKEWISVKDAPGFVSNRVLMLTVNEAVQVVAEGVSSAADVDRVFRSCFGHSMGPLETADLIGLDTIVKSLESLEELLGDRKFRPADLLVATVAQGHLGRKSGQGFYSY